MTKCPVCRDIELTSVNLERGLPARKCNQCEGLWLSSMEYLIWLKTATISPDEEEPETPFPVLDTLNATLCPDCGMILRRFKIWPDIDFHLDRCGSCNGVWFDKNEWEVLKAHNLHGLVNMFFTKPWQQKLKTEETRKRFETMYLDRFGADDYAEIKRVNADAS